jgi:uncharacterized protein YndB with AHSA1/START domain
MGALTDGELLCVRLERLIHADPKRVWRTVSSVDGMGRWLGPKTFEPQAGGRVLFDVQHGDTRWLMFGTVERFEPVRALSFTWQEIDTARLTIWPFPTLVTISLVPQDAGTLVVLEHSGF